MRMSFCLWVLRLSLQTLLLLQGMCKYRTQASCVFIYLIARSFESLKEESLIEKLQNYVFIYLIASNNVQTTSPKQLVAITQWTKSAKKKSEGVRLC